MTMAEGLFFGVGLSCRGRRALRRDRIGLHAGSAAPYIFPNARTSCQLCEGKTRARTQQAEYWMQFIACFPARTSCVFIRREHA